MPRRLPSKQPEEVGMSSPASASSSVRDRGSLKVRRRISLGPMRLSSSPSRSYSLLPAMLVLVLTTRLQTLSVATSFSTSSSASTGDHIVSSRAPVVPRMTLLDRPETRNSNRGGSPCYGGKKQRQREAGVPNLTTFLGMTGGGLGQESDGGASVENSSDAVQQNAEASLVHGGDASTGDESTSSPPEGDNAASKPSTLDAADNAVADIEAPSSPETTPLQPAAGAAAAAVAFDPATVANGGDDGKPPQKQQTAPAPEPVITTTSAAIQNGGASERSATPSLLGPRAPPPGPLRRRFPSFPWHRVPNLLTYARCVAIPVLALMFFDSSDACRIASSLLFAAASFTDWLDGYLARRWDITSSFGSFLDPVADKLIVSTALILLSGRHGPVVAVPTSIILAREIAVSALREWMAQRQLRDAVQVGYQGKVKTALTMATVALFLLVPAPISSSPAATPPGGVLRSLSILLLDACAVVTVTSGSVYFRAAAPILLGKDPVGDESKQ